MARLSPVEIEYIARLSKLELSEEEKSVYSEQLSSVLSYVEQLTGIDTEGVVPTANITGLQNAWRTDEVVESVIGYAEIEKNAPEFKNGSFVVPGVFE